MAAVLGLGVGDPIVKRLALKSMRNYLKYLVEFLELPVISTADDVVASIKFNGLHHFHDALARGKGVILASAHYGTIEIPGLRLKEMTDYHAVYDSFKPEYLD